MIIAKCLKCESTSRQFQQKKALVGAHSVIVKTTSPVVRLQLWFLESHYSRQPLATTLREGGARRRDKERVEHGYLCPPAFVSFYFTT